MADEFATGDAAQATRSYQETDNAALEAAKYAGVNQPSHISSSGLPGIGELAQRVEALEMSVTTPGTMGNDVWKAISALGALVDHIFNTHFRTADKAKIIADAAAARDEKLDI